MADADGSQRSLRALKLVTQLSITAVATKSYELFETIMGSEVEQEKKMEAAQLALDAAYQPGLKPVPPVWDPKCILDFLRYHVDPDATGEDHIHAVSSVIRAIDSASDDPTSQSWTWNIEDAGGLLTGLQQSPHPEGFGWWYMVLWIHYGGLDSGVRSSLDEIATNGDDRVDLKRCRIAVRKEIERVKELDGATSIVALEKAYSKLTVLASHGEKVRDELQAFGRGSFLFSPPVTPATSPAYPMAE